MKVNTLYRLCMLVFALCISSTAYSQIVANDLLMSQRNSTNSATLTIPINMPVDSSFLAFNSSTSRPTYFAIGTVGLTFDNTLKVIDVNPLAVFVKTVQIESNPITLSPFSPMFQVFNGAMPQTWYLPWIIGSENQVFYIKNRGTDDLTLAGQGSDEIYEYSNYPSIILPPGASIMIVNTGQYWEVFYL